MSLTRADDVELLVALHEGEQRRPRWSSFLDQLRRRCAADAAALVFAHAPPRAGSAAQWASGQSPQWRALDWTALALDSLRPTRVYALEEIASAQPGAPRHGRLMRVGADEAWSAWIIVARDGGDFTAADSVLLSALAPHAAIAMAAFAALERQRLRIAIMEDALARAGIRWSAHDQDGRLVQDEDPSLAAPLPERQLAALGAQFAHGEAGEVTLIGGEALAIPAPHAHLAAAPAASFVTLRKAARAADPRRQARCLEILWGLSPSEARLSLALANGQTLAEAGAALGLTTETARNYSKRVYAKSGARGLPDLVRLVLTSAAMLA